MLQMLKFPDQISPVLQTNLYLMESHAFHALKVPTIILKVQIALPQF
jgi:hypothetical protein